MEFSTFTPIESTIKQEMLDYYQANNLQPDNDYFARFLGLEPVQETPKVETKVKSKKIPLILQQTISPQIVKAPWNPTKSSSGEIGKAKDIMNFFQSKGLTKEQAAGLAGNFHAESGFNTTIVGDNGAAFGLAQWRDGRLEDLRNYAKINNLDPNTLKTQLEFVWHELNTTENAALKHLLKTKTVEEASESVLAKFERASLDNRPIDKIKREALSKKFFTM